MVTDLAPYGHGDPSHASTRAYRGHTHQQRFRVWISGLVRRVTAAIRCGMKRRAAIEPRDRSPYLEQVRKVEHRTSLWPSFLTRCNTGCGLEIAQTRRVPPVQ
jgi:hypothetical protein